MAANEALRAGRKQAPRDAQGRFLGGSSGNPGGRPRGCVSIRLLAREYSLASIERLATIVEEGDDRAAVAAAIALLDRGWGKPIGDAIERSEVIELMAKMGQAVDQYVSDPDTRQRIADHWAAIYGAVGRAIEA